MFFEEQISDYVAHVGSLEPCYGGGSVAALNAALAAALLKKVLLYSLKREKDELLAQKMQDAIARLEELRQSFLAAMDEDAKAFEPLALAYRLPKETEAEKASRKEAIQKGLISAAEAPQKLMQDLLALTGLIDFSADSGTKVALSDVICAQAQAAAAYRSAFVSFEINFHMMNKANQAHFQQSYDELSERLNTLDIQTETITKRVNQRLG